MENIETLQVGLQFKIENAKQIEGQAQDLVSKLSGSSVSMTKVSNEAKKTSTGLSKAVSTAKKFAFALLSVRGVWFAIRKSMTMYLAQNEELQTKLNSLYYAVGSMFAPLLEGLVNILAKAVSFINAIVKAMGFAGIDMSNFNKNAGGAAKALQKSLLAIDEINNLQEDKGGGGGVVMPTLDFESVKLPKWLEDLMGGIGGYLKTTIHGIGKLIMDEPLTSEEAKNTILTGLGLIGLGTSVMTFSPGKGIVITAAGLMLTGFSMYNVIKNKTQMEKEDLVKIILGSLGLAGLGIGAIALGFTAGGIFLTVVGAIVFTWSLTNLFADNPQGNLNQILLDALELDDLSVDTQRFYENLVYNPELMIDEFGKLGGLIETIGLPQMQDLFNTLGISASDKLVEGLQSGTLSNADAFKLALLNAGLGSEEEIIQRYGEFGENLSKGFIDSFVATTSENTEEATNAVGTLVDETNKTTENIDLSSTLAEETALSDETLSLFTKDVRENKDDILTAWGLLKTGVINIWTEIEAGIRTSTQNITIDVANMFNSLIDSFNSYCDSINAIGSEQKEFMGIGFTANHMEHIPIPQYAIGTNYVPNDQLAYLHKGEAVVPKKFNSSEFFGESSAEELNLLSSINEQLIELNRKDTTINLDSENVARVVSNAQQRLTQRNGNRVFALNR